MRARRTRHSSSRRRAERQTTTILIFFALVWIAGAIIVILYLVVTKKNKSGSSINNDSQPNANADKNQMFQPGQSANFNANVQDNVPEPNKRQISLKPFESPLLIFTCHRAEYLQQTLDYVYRYIPHDCSIGCPVVISQDGKDEAVNNVITTYEAKFDAIGVPLVHTNHPSALRGGRNAYQALAVHYGWALRQLFDGQLMADGHYNPPQRVIILEEDIQIAVDFFTYFSTTASLLDTDPTLFAVSAFNDNGFQNNVKDAKRLLRSDFFPGLGWMMNRRLWDHELSFKWPDGYWDDWLREPQQRQSRHIIRPEISRTYHFGFKGGASNNQFGSKLAKTRINDVPIDWQHEDISGLELEKFDQSYWKLIREAQPASNLLEALQLAKSGNTRVEYLNLHEFQMIAAKLRLMTDEKAGVPRTAYKGVVETRVYGEYILFITPEITSLQKEFT